MRILNDIEIPVSPVATRLRVLCLAALPVALAGCGGGGGQSSPAASESSHTTAAHTSAATSTVAVAPGVRTDSGDTDSCFEFTTFGPIIGPDCSTEDFFSYPTEDAIVAMTTLDYDLDIEPNDDLKTAAVLPIDAPLYDAVKNSVATFGTLSDGIDIIDNYTFATVEATQLGIGLCSDNLAPCGQQTADSNLDIGTAHIEIFDQFGQLLVTTVADSGVGNFVSVAVDGGVSYYVSVVGGNLPESQGYYLRVTRMPATDLTSAAEPGTPSAPDLAFYNESAFGIETGLNATFYWTAPTTNADGSPLLDLEGYVLYYGLVPEGPDGYLNLVLDHSQPLDVGLSAYTVTVPEHGHWAFTMTAVNAEGIESEPGMAISLTFTASGGL